MTVSGTCVPPGPSRNAVGPRSAEKRARTAPTSRASMVTRRTLADSAPGVSTVSPPRERLDRGEGTGLGRPWLVIVLNDDHNTFQGVAAALSAVIPGLSYDGGMQLANRIHNSGRAVVWSGLREQAELYWEQLGERGLTVAPLEQG